MRYLLVVLILLFIASCASIKTIEPMHKGEIKLTADIGGPLFRFNGMPIFMPLSSIGGAYGFNNSVSAYASLHTTSLMFGTIQLETSANTSLYRSDKSGFSTNWGSYNFLTLRDHKMAFYPFADLNYYIHYNKKSNYLYFSFSSMFELHRKKAFDEPVNSRLIPNFTLGHRWVKEKYEWGLELKWLNFFTDNRNIVVDYIAPGKYGALGLYFSYTKKF